MNIGALQFTAEMLTWKYTPCIEVKTLLEMGGTNIERDLKGLSGDLLGNVSGGKRHLRQKDQ